jgi:phenylpyruvate tautomerase PptA (4-oxalocrotonate tautomerase family)
MREEREAAKARREAEREARQTAEARNEAEREASKRRHEELMEQLTDVVSKCLGSVLQRTTILTDRHQDHLFVASEFLGSVLERVAAYLSA